MVNLFSFWWESKQISSSFMAMCREREDFLHMSKYILSTGVPARIEATIPAAMHTTDTTTAQTISRAARASKHLSWGCRPGIHSRRARKNFVAAQHKHYHHHCRQPDIIRCEHHCAVSVPAPPQNHLAQALSLPHIMPLLVTLSLTELDWVLDCILAPLVGAACTDEHIHTAIFTARAFTQKFCKANLLDKMITAFL